MSKTKSKKKYKLNPLAVVALVLCAAVAVYCGTTAWITNGIPLNPLRLTSLQDFDYTVEVSTDGGSNWIEKTDVLTFTKNQLSDLSNLAFRVKQTGNGVAFARVRVSAEWKKADNTRLQGEYNMPFNIATESNLFDNRLEDGCVYYAGAFPVEKWVNIFSSFDSANFDSTVVPDGVTLSLDVTVDAVQFNRYQQLWGMDSLPWR